MWPTNDFKGLASDSRPFVFKDRRRFGIAVLGRAPTQRAARFEYEVLNGPRAQRVVSEVVLTCAADDIVLVG
jgi:hypothetical protein